MRKIKFRQPVYDHDKQFTRFVYFEILQDGTGGGPVDNGEPVFQYSGKKDRTSKEIFEGDIVEQEAIMDYPGEYGGQIDRLYVGEVVIVPSKGVCLKKPYCIERNENNSIWRCQYYKNIASYRSKVIGNIHENPELLEEEQEKP